MRPGSELFPFRKVIGFTRIFFSIQRITYGAMEEGTEAKLPPHELGVVVGERVRFRFFGSTTRRADAAGTELERWRDGELEELAPIEVALPAEGRREGDVVPVRLRASVTEIGTLLLEAIPTRPTTEDERWKIEPYPY